MRSRFVHGLLLAAGVSLAGCATQPAPTDIVERNKRVVRTLYEECLNRGRLERLPELVADEYEGVSKTRGPDGFRIIVEGLRTGFPDIRYTIEDLLAEDDRVVIRWTWEGTHDGRYLVFPPSGKKHRVSGITIYEVKDGKIVRAWLQADRLGHLQQFGVVPSDIATRPPAEPK